MPILVGWAGGPLADEVSGLDSERIIAIGCRTAADALGIARDDFAAALVDGVVDDWARDPWARGAYSGADRLGRSRRPCGTPLTV